MTNIAWKKIFPIALYSVLLPDDLVNEHLVVAERIQVLFNFNCNKLIHNNVLCGVKEVNTETQIF